MKKLLCIVLVAVAADGTGLARADKSLPSPKTVPSERGAAMKNLPQSKELPLPEPVVGATLAAPLGNCTEHCGGCNGSCMLRFKTWLCYRACKSTCGEHGRLIPRTPALYTYFLHPCTEGCGVACSSDGCNSF